MSTDLVLALKSLLGVMIPLLGLSVAGLLLLSRSRLGGAIAGRIAGDSSHPDFEAQFEGLHEEMVMLKAQLAETHERVVFAERLLARGAAPPRELT